MTKIKDPYHPDFGATAELREKAITLSRMVGIENAALYCNVGKSTLYKWRKAYDDANREGWDHATRVR